MDEDVGSWRLDGVEDEDGGVMRVCMMLDDIGRVEERRMKKSARQV